MIKWRRMRWTGHVARMGAKKNARKILLRMTENERQLGRLRCRWKDNIKLGSGWGPMESPFEPL
jgi:hypothetical protein